MWRGKTQQRSRSHTQRCTQQNNEPLGIKLVY